MEWKPRYNIAPSQPHPVIVMENHHRYLDFMQWGLIPHWSKDKRESYKLINSRVESVKSKPIYHKLFQTKRCLVPADGFYEWKQSSSGKIPFRIGLKSGQLFAFAGLWDVWQGDTGEAVQSFTILTTEANALVSELHSRMPILLKRENEAIWLDPHAPQAKLDEALKPRLAQEMTFYEVSPIVNSWKTDNPQCIQPV